VRVRSRRMLFLFLFIAAQVSLAEDLPHIKTQNGVGQLIVHGEPFLILGGELGNSSAGTAEQADTIIPNAARMHVNTLLVPVAWEQIEPREGQFDFNILDHWIDVARENKLHLVPLWFGSWKNAFSNYAPAWVKSDIKRFPRAQAADGKPLEILSALSPENRRSDSRAYARLMRHIREKDATQQTVLMVQVENEVGYLGYGRDRSPEAENMFRSAAPESLVRKLGEAPAALARVEFPLQSRRSQLARGIRGSGERSLHGVELCDLHRSCHPCWQARVRVADVLERTTAGTDGECR